MSTTGTPTSPVGLPAASAEGEDASAPADQAASPAVDEGDTGQAGAAQTQAPTQAQAEGEPFDVTGMKVLIVDDNEQNVELLQAYLEDLPIETLTARDGVEAQQTLESQGDDPVDLVLLDVMMPRMSGFEVCQWIKGREQTADVAVMMVTALNELGDIERGVEAGTDEFVTKPVNKLELLTRVRSLLKARKLRQTHDDKDAYIRDLEQLLEQTREE